MQWKPITALGLVAVVSACTGDTMAPAPDTRSPSFVFTGSTVNLNTLWFQGFETDAAGWFAPIDRVPSGTGGITSATGGFHALAGGDAFSRFDGYRSVWPGDYVAEIDVYLDPAWAIGTGFDYSVASNNVLGAHLRDFIFHVGVADDGRLLVNGDNNTYGDVNSFILKSGTPFNVTAPGWYTLQHVFYDDGGVLAVDLNVLDAGGTTLLTITRKDLSDTIGETGVVGGNRYAWFVLATSTFAVDNHRLGTIVGIPGSKDDCKNGGWQAFGFRNQGQCVATFKGN